MKGKILHDVSKFRETLRPSMTELEEERRLLLVKELVSELETYPSIEISSSEADQSFGDAMIANWRRARLHEGEI